MKKMSHVPCVVCGKIPSDRAHIKSKGAGGKFNEANTIQLCREHHQVQHRHGWSNFIAKYPSVGIVLDQKGFEIREIFGVFKLVKK